MKSPGIVFYFFLIFIFWADRRIKGGRRAKNNPKWQKFLSHSVYQGFLPKMKNNNYIPHVPYLRNSIAYNQDFWYSCVKWWYLQEFVFFFYIYIFIFWAVRGVKGQKKFQDNKNILSVALHFSGTISYDCHLCCTYVKWKNLQELFHFLKILILWVVRGGGSPPRAKNSPK